MPRRERLVERLNAALHTLFDRHGDLYLLGEDIADPYGGAFKVTKGLSTRHPDRVLTTPISENAIVGAANGLALCGNRVIAEIMFGDFIALGFDQILNFATKSVSMYGDRKEMRLVVRCPVGGHRGYGPTHSQSLQKHFIGIPHLSLYELSAFHHPETLLEEAFDRGEPAIVFEPKALYAQRVHQGGAIDDVLAYRHLDGSGQWVHVYPAAEARDQESPELVVVAAGGTAGMTLDAARALISEDGVRVHVLVPAQLYPVALDPVLGILGGAAAICVAEESTAGGTWGTEVARHIHERLWGALKRPVTLLNSRDSVIPTAPHLERQVLLQSQDIIDALRSLAAAGAGRDPSPSASDGPTTAEAASGTGPDVAGRREITVPKLNNNDTDYVLVSWLVADGQAVETDQPIVEVETSKAIEELPALASGVLRHALAENAECGPGDVIGFLDGADDTLALSAAVPVTKAAPPAVPATTAEPDTMPDLGRTDPSLQPLSRSQKLVSQVVTASRREVPDAFVLRKMRLNAVDALQQELEQREDEPVELLELVVKLVGDLREEFPLCFSSFAGPGYVRPSSSSDVGVTFDAGNGLFIPVVREADARSVSEIADDLADFRMRAFRGTFTEHHLRDPSIGLSWNHDPDVVMVEPVIPPGVSCAVSVGGALEEVRIDESGRPVRDRVVHIGLAHDHRVVNGREAVAFLATLAAGLEGIQGLEQLVKCGQSAHSTNMSQEAQGEQR